MKNFKDLVFLEHDVKPYFNTQARMDFDNGYGISVITGANAYTNAASPYEVAVMHNGKITYNSGLADDVLGYQTEETVNELMLKIQQLQ